MPEPLYHRLLGCRELSTRTAIVFVAPKSRWGVRSNVNGVKPVGCVPSLCPFNQTSVLMYAPSKTIATRLPDHFAGVTNALRYQPTPAGKKPPGPPLGVSAAIGPAMDQS